MTTSSDTDSAIRAEGITRGFASGLAVADLSFALERGEVLALLGPNGAGKTTTVRLLNGVLRPDSGRAWVLGLDPSVDGDLVRRQTGVLTENAGLDDRLTARENLEFTARLRGLDVKGAATRVSEMIDRFGMADRADDLTQGFSTGQRKRVALARALLHDPEVLFLDEPTSGLDPAGTRDVISLIQDLASEGRTIVLATHFLGEAGRLATRMAVLHKGQLRAYGRPSDLAEGMWNGIRATLDLGGPADRRTLDLLWASRGVLDVKATDEGAGLQIESRDVLSHLIQLLVSEEVTLYGVSSHAPDLEDVYFEIERRILTESGEVGVTDSFAAPRERVG